MAAPGALFGVGGLIGLVTNAILQGAIIFGAASYFNGRPASLRECFNAGGRSCLPLIGLFIVMGVAVFFGMIGVTAFGLLFTPVFYVVMRAVSARLPQRAEAKR